MTTTTETKITRAEAVRRFQAATAYTVVKRFFGRVDTPNQGNGSPVVGIRREIEKVTTTGVYVKGGPGYALTTFKSGHPVDEWHDLGGGRLSLTTYRQTPHGLDEHMHIVYELEV